METVDFNNKLQANKSWQREMSNQVTSRNGQDHHRLNPLMIHRVLYNSNPSNLQFRHLYPHFQSSPLNLPHNPITSQCPLLRNSLLINNTPQNPTPSPILHQTSSLEFT